MAKAGRLREKVTIQRRDESALDEYRNATGAWVTVTTRKADILEMPGREAIKSGVLLDVAPATIRVRSDATTRAVTTADRIQARGVIWDIEATTELDAKQRMIEFRVVKGEAE
jgi:SPP1 family predicted phage head-tail adaptor